MILEDSIRIDAPAQDVWDVLLDVDAIAGLMPGVESVTQIDDRTFDGTIVASVGPIAGTFSFRARILDSIPPRSMTAEVLGNDSVTNSTVRVDTGFTLAAADDRATDLAYRADVQIQGRLAILGDMVLRATAALILEEFAKRLRQRVTGDGQPTT